MTRTRKSPTVTTQSRNEGESPHSFSQQCPTVCRVVERRSRVYIPAIDAAHFSRSIRAFICKQCIFLTTNTVQCRATPIIHRTSPVELMKSFSKISFSFRKSRSTRVRCPTPPPTRARCPSTPRRRTFSTTASTALISSASARLETSTAASWYVFGRVERNTRVAISLSASIGRSSPNPLPPPTPAHSTVLVYASPPIEW